MRTKHSEMCIVANASGSPPEMPHRPLGSTAVSLLAAKSQAGPGQEGGWGGPAELTRSGAAVGIASPALAMAIAAPSATSDRGRISALVTTGHATGTAAGPVVVNPNTQWGILGAFQTGPPAQLRRRCEGAMRGRGYGPRIGRGAAPFRRTYLPPAAVC